MLNTSHIYKCIYFSEKAIIMNLSIDRLIFLVYITIPLKLISLEAVYVGCQRSQSIIKINHPLVSFHCDQARIVFPKTLIEKLTTQKQYTS